MNTSPDRNSTLKLAGLGAALAFVATEASAAIVYTDNEDVTASLGCYGAVSTSFNPITGATDARTGAFVPEAIAVYFPQSSCGGAQLYFGSCSGSISSVGFLSSAVSQGTSIDASGTWMTASMPGSSPVTIYPSSFTDHFLIAYRFQIDSLPEYYYGWAEFSGGMDYSNGSTTTSTLYKFAYENSGDAIVAGAIPEPGMTAALFGFAAVAFIGFRRIRQRATRA